MNIRVFDNIEDPFLKSEWERLEVEADAFPQSTYHWCATWWKHLSGKRKLHVVMALDEEGKALGIAPLCIEQHFWVRVLRSFPIHFGDFFHIIISPALNDEDVFEAVLGYVTQYHRWDAALLTPINDRSRLYEFLRGKEVAAKHLVGNIVTDISSYTWDDYLSTLSRNRRRLTRKKMLALEAEHKIETELVTSEAGYLEYFDRIREMRRVRATKDRADRSDVYMGCAKEANSRLFSKGQMALYLLKANGTVIAYRIGILKSETYYDWNTNYDISWSDYSPGLISVAYVIRDLIEKGFSTLDFMAGVYDYKLSYSPKHEMRNNYLFVMGNRSIRSALFRKYQLDWRDRLRPHYRKTMDVISKVRSSIRKRRAMTNRLLGLHDRLRLYGFRAVTAQVLRALVRSVYGIERNIVFVIPGFSRFDYHDSCIKPMTGERIERAADAGELSPADVQLLTGFLNEGSKGVYAEVDGKLAGYAWVQYEGEYTFGRAGRMTIPPEHVFVKNLYVHPEFRGQKLGQKLNAARLSLIPSGCIPVVFIIPENRYAIRNCEKCGFERVLEVKQSQWFHGPWRTRITRLSPCAEADTLLKTLESANRI